MQSYYCKCRITQSYGSMPPSPCMKCAYCGTHPTWNGMSQPYDPKPHYWVKHMVDTDEGAKPITICGWCNIKKKDIK